MTVERWPPFRFSDTETNQQVAGNRKSSKIVDENATVQRNSVPSC